MPSTGTAMGTQRMRRECAHTLHMSNRALRRSMRRLFEGHFPGCGPEIARAKEIDRPISPRAFPSTGTVVFVCVSSYWGSWATQSRGRRLEVSCKRNGDDARPVSGQSRLAEAHQCDLAVRNRNIGRRDRIRCREHHGAIDEQRVLHQRVHGSHGRAEERRRPRQTSRGHS